MRDTQRWVKPPLSPSNLVYCSTLHSLAVCWRYEKQFFDNAVAYNNGSGTPTERLLYTYDAFGRIAVYVDGHDLELGWFRADWPGRTSAGSDSCRYARREKRKGLTGRQKSTLQESRSMIALERVVAAGDVLSPRPGLYPDLSVCALAVTTQICGVGFRLIAAEYKLSGDSLLDLSKAHRTVF